MRMGFAFGLVGVLALSTMVACGDDDDSSGGGGDEVSAEAKPYVDELKKSMTADDQELTGDLAVRLTAWRRSSSMRSASTRSRRRASRPRTWRSDSDMDFDELALTEAQGTKMVEAFSSCDVSLKDIFIDQPVGGRRAQR